MPRPNPIEYAERLYAAIRAANFSPLSFLAFGNAVKDGVELRRMPRIAVEPFMRVVGVMLDLGEQKNEPSVLDVAVNSDIAPPAEVDLPGRAEHSVDRRSEPDTSPSETSATASSLDQEVIDLTKVERE